MYGKIPDYHSLKHNPLTQLIYEEIEGLFEKVLILYAVNKRRLHSMLHLEAFLIQPFSKS
jgi:hypothetical protein